MTATKTLLLVLLFFGSFSSIVVVASDEQDSLREDSALEQVVQPNEANNNKNCMNQNGYCFNPNATLADLLNPHVLDNLDEIRDNLLQGKPVIIPNAFISDFADAMHQEISTLNFTLQERFDHDGFQVSQYNVYKWEEYTEGMKLFHHVLENIQSKQFIAHLTGRDTTGKLQSGASWFAPRGYVLPHDDHREMRTVSYVWHLSKDWRPEWGGALYWCPEDHAHAYVHASYNTLTLFSVTAKTIHMVTPVSPHATEKRLTFNGWYNSGWFPSAEDDLVSYLDTEKKRRELTENQIIAIHEFIESGVLTGNVGEQVEELMTMGYEETVGPPRFKHVISDDSEM